MWLLLITTVVITYLIQRHQLQWIPPSSCAMLLGVLAGGVSRLAGEFEQLRTRLAWLPGCLPVGVLPCAVESGAEQGCELQPGAC